MAGARETPSSASKDGSGAAHAAAAEIALAERLRGLTVHAARIERLATDYEIPMSTLRAADALGRGPKTFTIGRLIYCRREDWTAWLDGLAESGGTGPVIRVITIVLTLGVMQDGEKLHDLDVGAGLLG